MALRPEQKADAGKEGRMYDGSNEQGGRNANYASGAVRILERRIRRLEEIVLNGRPPDGKPELPPVTPWARRARIVALHPAAFCVDVRVMCHRRPS